MYLAVKPYFATEPSVFISMWITFVADNIVDGVLLPQNIPIRSLLTFSPKYIAT